MTGKSAEELRQEREALLNRRASDAVKTTPTLPVKRLATTEAAEELKRILSQPADSTVKS